MNRIFIWGTGKIAQNVLSKCKTLNTYEVLGFIDNNPQKVGTIFWGKQVYSSKILEKIVPDKIVVLTDAYEEIYSQILTEYSSLQGIVENQDYFYKESLLHRYENTTDKEIIAVLDYIRKRELNIFNYSFTEKYKNMDIGIFYDKVHGLYYVMHQGKPLYFSKKYDTEKKVLEYYRLILMEQDKESPHRYLSDDFEVPVGSVVVDVGVAEGNFSLEVIDRASKIYMIEADEDWIEALRITFKDYLDKVIIIKGFADSYNEGDLIALDSVIKEPVDFIKMDVEGSEWDALNGARAILSCSEHMKLAICVYHNDYDEVLVKDVLQEHGVKCSTTPGYMWYARSTMRSYVSTRLCRGLVRGVK